MARIKTQFQATACEPLFISVLNAARRLGIGQTSCWGLIKERKLPVVRLGRRTLVSVSALEAFVASLTSSASR